MSWDTSKGRRRQGHVEANIDGDDGAGACAIVYQKRAGASQAPAIEVIRQRGTPGIAYHVRAVGVRDTNGELIGFEIDVARKIAEDPPRASSTCRPPGTASSQG